jgi:hypothetical protein
LQGIYQAHRPDWLTPDVILILFLPALLFEGSLKINLRRLTEISFPSWRWRKGPMSPRRNWTSVKGIEVSRPCARCGTSSGTMSHDPLIGSIRFATGHDGFFR